ncbi:hypothetical protein [Microbulbifer epialgicus]|uniref:Sel1 repeat family protein n=1 Tax=Microbulbifer epialgicus TaxID=393907 RepID=A0ABV4NUH8_9GAMM
MNYVATDKSPIKIITYTKDGGVKETVVSKKILIFIASVFLFVVLAKDPIITAASRYEQSVELEKLRPEMTLLADNGQSQASLWLVKHYYQEENGRLPALISKGIPEALFIQGAKNIYDGQKVLGEKLISEAAAQGFAPAVKYTLRELK